MWSDSGVVADARAHAHGCILTGGVTSSAAGCRRASPPARPTSSVSTPSAASCGCSRRLRLSSAKPGKPASPTTWSHSSVAESSLGSRLITGPKNATPSGGSKWMIGRAHVLAGQGERLVGLGPDRRSHDSSSSASASSRGSPASARTGSDERAGPPPLTRRVPSCGHPSATCAASKMWAPKRGVQRGHRLAAVLRAGPGRHPQEPEPGGVTGFVLRREVGVVVDAGVDQPQRDEPPVHRVVALRLTWRTHLLVIHAKGQTGSK